MEKFPEAKALIAGAPNCRICSSEPVPRAWVERIHHPAYLDAVSHDQEGGEAAPGLSHYDRNRLGLPAHPELLARSILETSGTVQATFAALEEGTAANLAGGTHHAFPDRGLGFCVLNDVAVAIAALRHQGRHLQVLVVDTDAHQGNGTHAIFQADPSVFTYSIHVGPNYPAKKEPGDCDVPLPRYVDGKHYLEALRRTLPKCFEQTEPDLVFWISGADNHHADRFGQMRLSTAAMAERDTQVVAYCRAFAAPMVVLYGGGYNRESGKTASLHAQSICIAAH